MLLGVLMTACANPFADDLPEVSQEPLPGLAERPSGVVVAPAEVSTTTTPPGTTTGTPTGVAGATTTTSAASAGGGSDSTSTTSTAPPARSRAANVRVDDAAGDSGLGSPKYADGTELAIEDLGDAARVTVRLAAPLPTKLADQEVMGIGVDFFRSAGKESDFQLFADGGSDGWRAFLQTPDGFVRYPGAFRLSGDFLQFEVPWSALGGAPTGAVSVFVDWGKPTIAGVVTRTQDLVPDRGRAAFPTP